MEGRKNGWKRGGKVLVGTMTVWWLWYGGCGDGGCDDGGCDDGGCGDGGCGDGGCDDGGCGDGGCVSIYPSINPSIYPPIPSKSLNNP